MKKQYILILVLILGINSTVNCQIFGGCYGSTAQSLTSSNIIEQVSPNWIYNSVLEWDIDVTLFPPESNTLRSYVEVREYLSAANFCIGEPVDPSTDISGQYEFEIPYIPTNQTGSITITFDQDFFQKCFEWRIVTEGTFNTGQNCSTSTPWQVHSIFD